MVKRESAGSGPAQSPRFPPLCFPVCYERIHWCFCFYCGGCGEICCLNVDNRRNYASVQCFTNRSGSSFLRERKEVLEFRGTNWCFVFLSNENLSTVDPILLQFSRQVIHFNTVFKFEHVKIDQEVVKI